MITLQDVADKAGVSPATVSRVVCGAGKVGDKCRAHVQKIIDEMGYRPNSNARALASNRAEIIGIIVPNVSAPFFGKLASGAEQATRKIKYKLLISNSHHEQLAEREALDSFRDQGCQNIILHSKYTDDATLIQWSKEIPGLVLINRFIPAIAERCIWLDNISGGRQIAEYLIAKGHKKFAMITSETIESDAQDRLLGFRQVLAREGLNIPDENIIYNNDSLTAGFTAVNEFLDKSTDFTALITFNDVVAIGAINTLWDRNIAVPEQVSVVGFNDVMVAQMCRPLLTTVHYPVDDMAKYACQLSIELTRKKGDDEAPINKTHLFMTTLAERDSVKKL